MLNENFKKIIKNKIEYYRQKHIYKISFGLWTIVCGSVLAIFVLYYGVLGGVLNSHIRKNLDYPSKEVEGLKTTGLATVLINQEVFENLWTPNLPFIFPTYFLDNLPNFQLGEMSAISNVISSFSYLAGRDEKIASAAAYLKYPGDIWMFDKSGVLPVPSSTSQYKKGRKDLLRSNPLVYGLDLNNYSLGIILRNISKDLKESLVKVDTHIVEESSSWFDFKADNVFYYNQGKTYAYALFLRTLAEDYKQVLVEKNLYADFTSLIKALEDASQIDPMIVRNGDDNSSLAPNHLYVLGYYIQKALIKFSTIERGLK